METTTAPPPADDCRCIREPTGSAERIQLLLHDCRNSCKSFLLRASTKRLLIIEVAWNTVDYVLPTATILLFSHLTILNGEVLRSSEVEHFRYADKTVVERGDD